MLAACRIGARDVSHSTRGSVGLTVPWAIQVPGCREEISTFEILGRKKREKCRVSVKNYSVILPRPASTRRKYFSSAVLVISSQQQQQQQLEGCIDDERQFKTAKRPQASGDATVRQWFFRDNFVIFRRRSKRIVFWNQ